MKTPIFRGKSLSNGELVEGQVHTYGDGVFIAQTRMMNNGGLDWRVPAIEIEPNSISRFVRTDLNGTHVFEGDKIEYQLKGGMYLNKGEVVYDDEMCGFVVHSDRSAKRYLPLLSNCIIFSRIS